MWVGGWMIVDRISSQAGQWLWLRRGAGSDEMVGM